MADWKRILYIVAAIQVGTGISIIGVISFIPLFLTSELGVTDPGEAAFWSGLISGATPLFVAVAAPFWTLQADRRGPRFALSMILLILTVVIFCNTFVETPIQFLVLRMLQGASGGFIAVGMSLVMSLTPKEKMPWAMGVFQASMVSGIMLGPLAGGVIADSLGYRMPFLIFSALTLLCLMAVHFYIPEEMNPGQTKKKEPFLVQLRCFMRNPVILLMIFIQFLCNAGMTGIGPILPLYIKEMLGDSTTIVATLVGIIIFVSAGVSCLASLSLSHFTDRFPIVNILLVAAFVTGVNFIFQYLMPTVFTLGAVRALLGLSLGMIMPITNTILASAAPDSMRTMVVGFAASFSLLGNVFGPFVSGTIAMQFGYAAVFWSTAACFFVMTAMIFARKHLITVDLGKKDDRR